MALPVRRLTKVMIALVPVALLARSIATQVFWLGDIGGLVIALIATWAWLVGVASSGDIRSLGRFVARGVRAIGGSALAWASVPRCTLNDLGEELSIRFDDGRQLVVVNAPADRDSDGWWLSVSAA